MVQSNTADYPDTLWLLRRWHSTRLSEGAFNLERPAEDEWTQGQTSFDRKRGKDQNSWQVNVSVEPDQTHYENYDDEPPFIPEDFQRPFNRH